MIDKIKASFGINEGLLILVLTAISYVGAFSYGKSYLDYYGISEDLVYVETQLIIVAGLSVLLITGGIFHIFNMTTIIVDIKFKGTNFARLFDIYGMWFLFALILTVLAPTPWYAKLILLIIAFHKMWYQLITPIFYIKEFDSYDIALGYIMKFSENEIKPIGFIERYDIKGNLSYFMLVILAVYVFIVAGIKGEMDATNKNDYAIDNENRVLIKTYRDYAILAYVESNSFTGQYIIVPISELKLHKTIEKFKVQGKESMDDKMDSFLTDLYNKTKIYISNITSYIENIT